jgi:predicted transposase YbfD/YdcC
MRKPTASIVDHFQELVDPRIERNKKHTLIDIIVLTICAVITGSETWEEIEDYGHKEDWLKSFLALENGIPSHDTIRRLFIRLNPDELQRCFMSWIESVRDVIAGDVIAVDGKTLRRSGEQVSGKSPIHMVSAWAAGTGMILGQKKTAEKSNEIAAIPALLELLKIKGCIVTIDAMGYQTEIGKTIRKKKADYVFALKGNQKNLHEDVKYFFHELDEKDLGEEWLDNHKTVDKDHGRIEIREYYQSNEIDWLPEQRPSVW